MSDTKETENYIVEKVKEASEIQKSMSKEQLAFAKGLINPKLTDIELLLFMKYASFLQLDPMNKEIIAVVYEGQNGRQVNTITTRNGKRVVATRTGELDNIITEPIYIKKKSYTTKDADGKDVITENTEKVEPWESGILWGAQSIVIRKGHEFKAVVPFKEYNTGKNVWASKPETMIKKVAESQALSLAFPEILGGLFDEVEVMDSSEEREAKVTGVIESALKERKAKKADSIIVQSDIPKDDDPKFFDGTQAEAEAMEEISVKDSVVVAELHIESDGDKTVEVTTREEELDDIQENTDSMEEKLEKVDEIVDEDPLGVGVLTDEQKKAEAEKLAEVKKNLAKKDADELQERIDRAKNYHVAKNDSDQLPLVDENANL